MMNTQEVQESCLVSVVFDPNPKPYLFFVPSELVQMARLSSSEKIGFAHRSAGGIFCEYPFPSTSLVYAYVGTIRGTKVARVTSVYLGEPAAIGALVIERGITERLKSVLGFFVMSNEYQYRKANLDEIAIPARFRATPPSPEKLKEKYAAVLNNTTPRGALKVNRDGCLLDGFATYLAYQALEIKDVEVMVIPPVRIEG